MKNEILNPDEFPLVTPQPQPELERQPQTPIDVIEGALDYLRREEEEGEKEDDVPPTIH